MTFVPDEFQVPVTFDGPGFRLEPLGPKHNERDFDAWMSSIEHIHATPGFPDPDDGWPYPMTLDDNLSDLVAHARHFEERQGFTYSILEPDGDRVIGCVYLYPTSAPGYDAEISSWVRETHAHLDEVVWRSLNEWMSDAWPFEAVKDDPRPKRERGGLPPQDSGR